MLNALDYDEYIAYQECAKCLEKEQRMDDASEYLEEIVKQLYSKESLNKDILEHCLEELCFHLRVKFPRADLTISRKPQEMPMLQQWVKYNNNYLQKLA